MYRLLIVTDDQNVRDMFASMEGWEALGFKPPRLRDTVEEAMECMRRHTIDAIAVKPSPAYDELLAYLNDQRRDMPVFQIEHTAEEQLRTVREVYSLLTRIHADDSNDDYDPVRMLEQQRERWMRKVIGGLIPSLDMLERQRIMYRCLEKLDVPCVLARLELPTDDDFLSERWHYGSERLEVALRNFFGREHDHMLMHVAVISQEEVRILCYPLNEEDGLSENAAYDYVQETVEQIAGYLGLEMKVTDVRRIAGLKAFAAENGDL